jgi:hypothetical protein
MINWLKKKLGILSLARRMELLEKDMIRIYKSQNTLENKTRNRPERYDQIERARKRRYKKSA